MNISSQEDTNQQDINDRNNLATCPVCGQKLFAIESLHVAGLFRVKCRRCKKYIRVSASEE